MMAEFRNHWKARTPEEREAAFKAWFYSTANKSGASEEQARVMFMRRYVRPDAGPWIEWRK